MKKTFKILLFTIFILAMALPIMSFAGAETEYVIDLSSANAFAIPISADDVTYVLTGTNKDAEVRINGDCDIILRGAALRRIHIDHENSYTVNITLEGENTINQYNWASQAALSIYSSDVTINGGENDSLNAASIAFTAFSNSNDLGCLTVNGGKITFESTGGGNPFQTNYVQNGGTVKVIENSDYSFLYDAKLNGGSLEVINNRASNGIVFSQSLWIKKGADLKISIPNTPYVAYSNIRLAEDSDANDCVFVRFDESSEFVYLDESNSLLNGKNYAEIKVVEHAHTYDNGKCACGFICGHNTDNGTCGICGKYIYKIIHHPTVKEPYVALNDGTGASYQWYEVKGLSEITSKNKTYPWSYFEAPFETESTYSEANGWSAIDYSYEGSEYKGLYYIITPFNAGDKVTLSFSSNVVYADLFTMGDAYAECEIDGATATAVISEDGIYGIYAETENTEPTVKMYVGDSEINAVTGQTSATLSKYSYGAYYFCKVTANDGTVHESRLADFTYKITHQPTDKEQYVSLNSSDGASYQWYFEKDGRASVTDENSYPFTVFDAPPEIGGVCDSENGWTPDEYGYYFVVKLKEGDILNLEFSQTPTEAIYLYSSVEGTVEDDADITVDASITAEADGYYGICAADGGTLKATMNGPEYIAVNGQTEATLNADKLGNYLCEVTFKDGKKEMSEAVSVQHLHTGGTANCKDKAICTSCGLAYGKINADKHKSLVILDAVASTCTKTGTTEGKKCTACGKVTVAQQTVAKKAHTYKTVTTKATLSKNGKIESKCSCGKVKSTQTIAKISSVTLSATKYIHDGNNKTPKVTVKDANGKKLVKNTDYKLSVASKRSGIGRYTVKVTFIGKYSGTKNVYFTILPGKPATVKASSQTTSSVKLTWSKVSGAAGYTVYRYSPSKKAYVKAGTTEGTSLTVKGLLTGTKYTFKVVAYGKTSGGKVYNSEGYTLLKTATKTKTPELTKVTASSTKGKAYVYHSNVSGETGYTVYYSTSKTSGFKKYANFKADTTRCDITGLTSGKTYYFKVRTYIKTDSGYVYSPWSAVKGVKVK